MTMGLEPVVEPFDVAIAVPGSKSMTIRALTVAALATGRSHIYGALDAEDTRAMVGALRALGVLVENDDDPWGVEGVGGHFITPEGPISAGESALTARIVIALATLAHGPVTIDGSGSLRERPMLPLVDSLAAVGVGASTTDGCLPVRVNGLGRPWGGEADIDTSVSSQFLSALLLVAPLGQHRATLRVVGERGSAGYIDLTTRVMTHFGATVTETITGFEVENTGYQPADIQVDPDVSAAVYPMVAAAITGSRVTIEGIRLHIDQPDIVVARHLEAMGCTVVETDTGLTVEGPDGGRLDPIEVTMSDAPDGALALSVACLFAGGVSRIGGLGSWRHKESDRLSAMREGLESLGAVVQTSDDTITIRPGAYRGGIVDPHGDHRVAMALALGGLRIPGVSVSEPSVVDKSWPGYWETMSSLAG